MVMKYVSRLLIAIFLILTMYPVEGYAMMHGKGHHMRPYGGYCKGPKWGWYGAGRHVKSEEEVRELVSEFLTGTELTAGEIRDEQTYFEVDIKSEDGQVVDLLIVDKRSCRIRSAY